MTLIFPMEKELDFFLKKKGRRLFFEGKRAFVMQMRLTVAGATF
jgi:hypothetical protein